MIEAGGTTEARFFFVHVMKTGGATFRRHVYSNFPDGEVYPNGKYDPDMQVANWDIAYLLSLPQERLDRIRAFTGHFPFVVTKMMGIDFTTLTILRDPVARTISYLKHAKRYHAKHQEWSLEEIYDDPLFFPCFMHNHQAKIFAMTEQDRLESYMDVIEIDERRLEIARSHLEEIDVLGVNEHHAEFLAEVEDRFGWKFGNIPNQRVAEEEWEVPASLRARIVEDNQADIEFYEFAKKLEAARRRSRVGA